MTITNIVKTKRGRYSIYLDDEFYGVLHLDVYLRGEVKSGEEIDPEELDELIGESMVIIAKERALQLLSARSYTRKSLVDKLLRDVDEESANKVADRMEELGLIDDRDYAIRYAKDCINLRGYSHFRVVNALYSKGIPKKIIEETMEVLGEEQSEKLIGNLLKTKYKNKISDKDDVRRTISALLRRGFRYNDIVGVINRLSDGGERNYDYD